MSEVEKYAERKAILLNSWKESFLQSDMNLIRSKYDEASKKFFGKGRALNTLVAEIQSFASFQVQVFQIPAIIADIEMFQKEKDSVEEKRNQLSFEWKQIIAACPTKRNLETYRDNVKRQLSTISKFSEKLRQMEVSGEKSECIERARSVVSAFGTLEQCQSKAVELLQLTFDENETNWIEGRLACCDNLIQNADKI